MGYPDPPNWQSGQPLAGWFLVRLDNTGDRMSVCAGQGRGTIKALQRKLNALGGLIGPALTIDGNAGSATLRALVNVANRVANSARNETDRGYFRTIEGIVAADERSRNISRGTWAFALWVAYYLRDYEGQALNGTTADRVFVPLNTVYPRFGSAPDDDRGLRNGELVCWDRDRDPAPTPATREQVDQARATGSTGIAPGGSGTPATTGGGAGTSSMGKVVLGAAVIGGVVYLVTRKRRRRGGRRGRR